MHSFLAKDFLYGISFLILGYGFIKVIGYCICAIVVRYLKNRKESIKGWFEVKPGTSRLAVKVYFRRLVQGYLRYSMLNVGRISSHHVRNYIYKYVFGINMGKNVVIYSGMEVRSPWNVRIGNGSIVGDECKLDGRTGIDIGENVNISTGVWIWTFQHDPNCEYFSCRGEPVVIGDRAWICSRVTIMPGVTIGEGAVIAAGAVVVGNIDPFAIYGGIPAKKIADRTKDLKYTFYGDYLPFC